MMILGLRLNLLRVFPKSSRHLECFNSTVVTNVGVHLSPLSDQTDKPLKNPDGATVSNETTDNKSSVKLKSSLVAAAFSSLGSSDANSGPMPSLDSKISQAKTADELLSLMDKQLISKMHAYKVFSILSDWTMNKKVEVSDLEKDPRFIKLCEFLNKTVKKHISAARNEKLSGDINIVSEISNEDHAARLSSTLNLQQSVKVLHSLAMKQKRSLTLLRSLAFNIAENSDELNIKLCADVLYSLACLNYPDDVLIARVATDLSKCIDANERPSVIKSIIMSIGLLRYRDTELLDQLSNWILKHFNLCRPQELTSLIQTLASVNYRPANEEVLRTILPSLTLDKAFSFATSLDVVWSLALLGEANNEHVTSVLSPEFIDKLMVAMDGLPVVFNLKLLQIYGFAKLVLKIDPEKLLPRSSELHQVSLHRGKEKQTFVNGVFSTLANLLPSSVYLTKDIDLGYGFLVDGMCRVDDKMTPIALVDKKTGASINENRGNKIAIMVFDYHDFCRGSHNQLTGLSNLCLKLTQLSGYKVLSVPYHEFNLQDKLPGRVQYLENKLKLLIKEK